MMDRLKSYEEWLVWQKGMRLAGGVYKLSARFHGEEADGLPSRIRRASYSAPFNIAEGYGHATARNYLSYRRNACARTQEAEAALLPAIEEERKMPNTFIKSLPAKSRDGRQLNLLS